MITLRELCNTVNYNTSVSVNVWNHYIIIKESNKDEMLNVYGDMRVRLIETHPYSANMIIAYID